MAPSTRTRLTAAVALGAGILLGLLGPAGGLRGEMQRVRASDDRRGFVLATSGRRFVPWGFNYDHDGGGRLIEDYWDAEWATVEQD
ncbi:MAG TPA: hypothetical protein VM431_07565, partial [Phycisphaerae bacterium]|nr:hypothetical protein [Phycisphaerae bacterium]